MHRYKTAWYSIRPPVSTRDFQAVKLEGGWGVSGVPGVGGRYWQRGRAEGEWGGAGRQHRPYVYSYIIRKRDAPDRWWILDSLGRIFRVTALSRSFGRSEGNGTSQLLVLSMYNTCCFDIHHECPCM